MATLIASTLRKDFIPVWFRQAYKAIVITPPIISPMILPLDPDRIRAMLPIKQAIYKKIRNFIVPLKVYKEPNRKVKFKLIIVAK